MFGYPCPSCSQRLLAAPERVGQRTICPKCLKPIVIPSPAAVHVPPPPMPVPSALSEDDPEHIFQPIVVPGQPLTHDVDDDQESALRADLAAQADDMDSTWREVKLDDLPLPGADRDQSPTMAELNLEDTPPAPPTVVVPPPPQVILPPPVVVPPPPVRPTARISAQAPSPAPRPVPVPPPVVSAPTPPPQPTVRRPAAAVDRSGPGMVVFNPTAVESMDIAADLTAALTLRMKPPPEPPSDLPLSTGLWLALSAIALSLWLAGTLYGPGALGYVLAIGVIEILFGLGWVVGHAVQRGGPAAGLVALLPPVTLMKLVAPPPSLGRRPLRFVLTGAVLVGLYSLALQARPVAQNLFGVQDQTTVTIPEVVETPLLRLSDARRQDAAGPLVAVLSDLSAPSALVAPGADTKVMQEQVVEKLRELATADPRSEVRAAALTALVTWAGEAAKPEVLKALGCDHERERRAAVGLAPRWKDRAVAAAVAARLGDREEAADAAAALKKLGGEPAEAAVVPLIADSNLTARSYALEVLAAVGGPTGAGALEAVIGRLKSEETRRPYRQALAEIQNRK